MSDDAPERRVEVVIDPPAILGRLQIAEGHEVVRKPVVAKVKAAAQALEQAETLSERVERGEVYYRHLATLRGLDEAMVGYVLASAVLGVPRPQGAEPADEGAAVWAHLEGEGWTVDQIQDLHHAVVHHDEVASHIGFVVAVNSELASLDETSTRPYCTARMLASLRVWGTTDAWKQKDPDEVARLTALEYRGRLSSIGRAG